MLVAVLESVGDHPPHDFRVLCSFALRHRLAELIEDGGFLGGGEGGRTGFLCQIDERIVVGTVDPIRASTSGQI